MAGALAAAAEHDAAGRHDEAVDTLALAAQGGDLEATVSLGIRLLVGDRAPYLPRDGIVLLSDAARAGSTEGALRLAPLAALGAHVPQDWGHALGLLTFAAERGSDDARGQLRALAARRDGTAESSDGWRRIAQSIDWQIWLAPPEGVTLHERPLVRSFPGLVSDSVCEWLRGRAAGRLRRALIYDPGEGGNVADHMRTNSLTAFDLGSVDVVQAALQHRMAVACGVNVHNAEGPTILHYQPGEQITNHFDFVNVQMPGYEEHIAQRGERIITFLAYLNDDYDGGDTDFPKIGVRHKGRRGEGLFFTNALPSGKPDFRMVHAGMPPLRGEKWIVSQFFRSRAALNTRAENVG
jgi:prolyl 4-hydroxylase